MMGKTNAADYRRAKSGSSQDEIGLFQGEIDCRSAVRPPRG